MSRTLALLLLGVLLQGCSARRRAEDTLVRKIRFEGTDNHLFSPHAKSALASKMTQQPSGWGVLGPLSFAIAPELLDRSLLAWDERPIEVFLAHEGWFDADLVRWETRELRPARRRKVAAVDVVGHVVLGEPTVWDATSPAFEWVGEPLLPTEVMQKLLSVRPGRRVQLDEVEDAEADLVRLLQEHGHALAQVSATVELDPVAHTAHAVLTIEPGASYTVGVASIEGNTAVDHDRLLEVLDLPVGEPWTATLVDDARDRIYGLGAFRQVQVRPGEPGEGPDLPMRIAVVDGRPRKVAVTGSLGFEGPFFVPRASLTASHDNVGGRLQRVEVGASVGAGATLTGDVLPLYALRAALHSQRFLGTPVAWSLEATGANELFEGVIPRRQAEVVARWERDVGPVVVFGGPSFGVTQFPVARDGDQPVKELALGLDTPNPFPWMAMELGADLDLTNRRDTRLHGWRAGLLARQAWVPRGPNQRLEMEVLAHLAPHQALFGRPVQWTARLRGRHVFGDDVIWPERLFLGGSSSLRSFRAAGVGPYDSVCVDRQAYGLRQVYLAQGAKTSAMASTELELHRVFHRDLALTTFAEAGVLGSEVRYGAGVGARYDTPLGPFRVAVAFRPLSPEDSGPVRDLNCSLPRRRAFDLVSELGRYEPFNRDLPAINLVLSLGLP